MTRKHLAYREPSGWTSRPDCLEDQAAAERLRNATNLLGGHSAAARRTWHITDCDDENCGASR